MTQVLKYMCLLIFCTTHLCVEAGLPVPSWLNRGRRQSDGAEVNVVDLHNDEFCVDVSTYGEVTFEATPREKCDTIFVKNCENKNEQVCDEVTEITCDIVPYTKCSMNMEVTPYKSYEMVPKVFNKKTCSEGMDTIQHTKMMPECRNVTKQNCITNWETDGNGNQVWAGNEDCEPVTWRECQLVPRQVDFKVPKVTCVDGEPIPYTDCQEADKEQMTSSMTCEVKHTTSCTPTTSMKCQNINFKECKEEPMEKCEEQMMMVPMQEKEHKKKCLLPDGAGSPRSGRRVNNLISPRGNAKTTLSVSESQRVNAAHALPIQQLPPAVPPPVQRHHNQRQQKQLQQHQQVQQQQRRFQGSVGAPRVGQRTQHGHFVLPQQPQN